MKRLFYFRPKFGSSPQTTMNENQKKNKRITIYDIARELGIAPSSVSKALNDLPSISDKIKLLVKSKAAELNYKHNVNAANLRKGSSRTIGVVVPKINVAFFSSAISGMEEACYENNYRLIICQSDESYVKEVQAVETLIRQNVDCIIISLSMETRMTRHLQDISSHKIELIQFDRVDHGFPSHIIINDNQNGAYKAVKHLIEQGYKKIALLGGPDHLSIYRDRKEGYLQAIREADLTIPYNYILENALTTEAAMKSAEELLRYRQPPDAFFTITDYSALGVLKTATAMGLKVPEEVGIIGFANETFTAVTSPTLSSVDQQSRQLGKEAASAYFNYVLQQKTQPATAKEIFKKKIIECNLAIRSSSLKQQSRKKNLPASAPLTPEPQT